MSSGEWVWMKGSNSQGASGSYGTKGVEATINNPGCRGAYSKWKDTEGNFWMFAGCNYSSIVYNDLWRYNLATNNWTWMGGNNSANGPGNAGNECVDSSDFISNPRFENRACWTDTCGHFWSFGGWDASLNAFNDLWIYSPAENSWAWVGGSLTQNATAVYGTQGVAATDNQPGSRGGGVGWIDNHNNLWMYGGFTYFTSSYFNDLWKFTPDSSCPATFACNLAIQQLPSSQFAVSDSAFCPATCIDFTDLSANNPTSWQWSFPGGTPSLSTDQNPSSICYASAGMYDVTLIASNASGADTLFLPGFVTVFSAAATVITQSNDTLESSPAYSYQWLMNGTTIPGATSQTLVITQTGMYIVDVTDSNGCFSADTIIVDNIPSPGFSVTNTSICEKFCTSFTDQSTNNPTLWQWFFPGGNPSSSTDQNPSAICYTIPGTYDVTLITTNANGNDTLTLYNYITVYPTPPFPTITQVGYTLTSSPASSYQWQFNTVDIPGATSQSYTILQSGYYTVIVGDSNSCFNAASKYVLISGIQDVMGDAGISIYPNPSSGNFMVEFSYAEASENRSVEIKVVNTLGQKVFSCLQKINGREWKKEIDLGDVARGIYFIEIKTGNDNTFSAPMPGMGMRKKIVIVK